MESERRPWRTNVGLRLTKEVGEWFEQKCREENRAYANYVEWLIIQERKRLTKRTAKEGG